MSADTVGDNPRFSCVFNRRVVDIAAAEPIAAAVRVVVKVGVVFATNQVAPMLVLEDS